MVAVAVERGVPLAALQDAVIRRRRAVVPRIRPWIVLLFFLVLTLSDVVSLKKVFRIGYDARVRVLAPHPTSAPKSPTCVYQQDTTGSHCRIFMLKHMNIYQINLIKVNAITMPFRAQSSGRTTELSRAVPGTQIARQQERREIQSRTQHALQIVWQQRPVLRSTDSIVYDASENKTLYGLLLHYSAYTSWLICLCLAQVLPPW